MARKGLPIYTNLCQRKSGGVWSQCPYFAGCEYIQTRQAAYSSPFVILVHSHLGLEWGATAAERYWQEHAERRAMPIWYNTKRPIHCIPADKKRTVH